MTSKAVLTLLFGLGALAATGCRSKTLDQPIAPVAKAPSQPVAKLPPPPDNRPAIARPQYRTTPAAITPAPTPVAAPVRPVAKKGQPTLQEELKVIPTDRPRKLTAWQKRAQNF